MVVLVTGGRAYQNKAALFRVLDEIHAHTPITTIVHGACGWSKQKPDEHKPEYLEGADGLAHEWATENVVDIAPYIADWSRDKRGGPDRNERMVSASKPDLSVVCPGQRGTADCRRRLVKHQVPIVDVSASACRFATSRLSLPPVLTWSWECIRTMRLTAFCMLPPPWVFRPSSVLAAQSQRPGCTGGANPTTPHGSSIFVPNPPSAACDFPKLVCP